MNGEIHLFPELTGKTPNRLDAQRRPERKPCVVVRCKNCYWYGLYGSCGEQDIQRRQHLKGISLHASGCLGEKSTIDSNFWGKRAWTLHRQILRQLCRLEAEKSRSAITSRCTKT